MTCGATEASDSKERTPEPLGWMKAMLLMKSLPTLMPVVVEPTSTVGGRPTTTTVSPCTDSGWSWMLTRTVRSVRTLMSVRE